MVAGASGREVRILLHFVKVRKEMTLNRAGGKG